MYSYYVDRGYDLAKLINMSLIEKTFYYESMIYNKDERVEEHNAKWGGEKK